MGMHSRTQIWYQHVLGSVRNARVWGGACRPFVNGLIKHGAFSTRLADAVSTGIAQPDLEGFCTRQYIRSSRFAHFGDRRRPDTARTEFQLLALDADLPASASGSLPPAVRARSEGWAVTAKRK